MWFRMPYIVPIPVRITALALGALLSVVVVIAESPLAAGAALVILTMTLLFLEAPSLHDTVEDESE